MKFCQICGLAAIAAAGAVVPATPLQAEPARRPAVHPRRNVEEFSPIPARFVRMTIERATSAEPCLDEFEIYGPEDPEKNLALAEYGTIVRASGTLDEYRIHELRHVNDGLFGNSRSWICDTERGGWVEFELPAPAAIERIVWSRDREGKFIDRLPVDYQIEVALTPGDWIAAASSKDRARPEATAAVSNPGLRSGVRGFAWSGAAPAAEPQRLARKARNEYTLSTWTTADGLPSNTITDLAQSRDGWLWIGTTHGVARFDGAAFTTFSEGHGLSGSGVSALCEDAKGNLWVATLDGGLSRWNESRFDPVALDGWPEAAAIAGLAADAGGSIWAATGDGLLEIRGDRIIRHGAGVVSDVTCPPDRPGAWFCQDGLRWTGGGFGSVIEEIDPTIERSRFSSLDALAAGPDGALWFGGANRYVGRLSGGATETFAEDAAALTTTVWNILPAAGGDVWFGTAGSGLLRLRGREVLAITTEDGLPANSVPAVCQDMEGNLWAGTSGGGLAKVSRRRVQVVAPADGLSHPAVIALAETEDGAVWIGTNGGGLNRWQNGQVEPVAPNYIMETESVAALAPIPGGGVWISAAFSGLARLDSAGEFRFLPPIRGEEAMAIHALVRDGGGDLWIGTQRGVFHLPASFGGAPDVSDDQPALLSPTAGLHVTALAVDAEGALWIGTAGDGAARWDGGSDLRRWSAGDGGLPSAFVRTFRVDDAGAVWAGTDGGLCRWRDLRTLETFTSDHGLPDAVVSQILDDGAGHLWLGTNRGILRVPQASFDAVAAGRERSLETLALGISDGLPTLECAAACQPGGLRLRDGRLCFGTGSGVAVIDPKRFVPLPAPPVRIQSLAANESPPGRPGRVAEVSPAGPVTIHFTAPSFTAPQRVRFRWRLAGLDDSWSEPTFERAVSFRRLPPGRFRFEVASSAEAGPWSSSPASLVLEVPAPWWRTPWAIAAAIAAGVLMVAALTRHLARRRVHRRLREVESAFALEAERSRIARDIHDTLGANLTSITLHSAIGRAESEPSAARHFDAISATAGELVQSLDGIVWAVNPEHDTVESLARYLMRFAEEFCASLPIRLRLDVPEELPHVSLRSEVRHDILLAAREALNNAVRHSGASRIHLSIDISDGQLRVVIEDDGRGFDQSRILSSRSGLANMKRRLELSGGACRVESSPGEGARVTLILPIPDGESDYPPACAGTRPRLVESRPEIAPPLLDRPETPSR